MDKFARHGFVPGFFVLITKNPDRLSA